MRIVISGSTGLIGSALVPHLAARGHEIVRLVRGAAKPGAARWDPERGTIDSEALAGVEAAVHLAGENIGAKRWTPAQKARIRDSRVRGTRLLCEALAGLHAPPRAIVCASGIGYYGDRGDEIVREESPPGSGFLADVCVQWEAAAEPARRRGMRVVHLRTAMVLAPRGGALARMLPLFRLGLGGKLGSGRQWMSWIALDDHVRAIERALEDARLEGAVNSASPHPVRNDAFTRILARVLHRPAALTVPAFALRLALGEMAGELLLYSTRAEPARLAAAGHAFLLPDLEGALRTVLRRPAAP